MYRAGASLMLRVWPNDCEGLRHQIPQTPESGTPYRRQPRSTWQHRSVGRRMISANPNCFLPAHTRKTPGTTVTQSTVRLSPQVPRLGS
jgi:hypothetical protein